MNLSGHEEIMKRRGNDDRSNVVRSRLDACNNLRAEEAIYHHVCKSFFPNVTDGSLTSTASLLFAAHLRNMQEDPKMQKSRTHSE